MRTSHLLRVLASYVDYYHDPNPSLARPGLSALASHSAVAERPNHRHLASQRDAPSLRTSRGLIGPEFLLTNGCAAVRGPPAAYLWIRGFKSRFSWQ
jgi:hypothetical protein